MLKISFFQQGKLSLNTYFFLYQKLLIKPLIYQIKENNIVQLRGPLS